MMMNIAMAGAVVSWVEMAGGPERGPKGRQAMMGTFGRFLSVLRGARRDDDRASPYGADARVRALAQGVVRFPGGVGDGTAAEHRELLSDPGAV